jgi:hypothetical protein
MIRLKFIASLKQESSSPNIVSFEPDLRDGYYVRHSTGNMI